MVNIPGERNLPKVSRRVHLFKPSSQPQLTVNKKTTNFVSFAIDVLHFWLVTHDFQLAQKPSE